MFLYGVVVFDLDSHPDHNGPNHTLRFSKTYPFDILTTLHSRQLFDSTTLD